MVTPPTFYPPGAHIREEIEARGWSQADLADVLGVSAKTVNEILTAKRSITTETARALGEAFGTGAEVWLRLEGRYQLSRLAEPGDAVSRRARLYSKAPVGELQRRGWLMEASSIVDLESQVCYLLRIEHIDAEPTPFPLAARASNSSTGDWTPSQLAWYCRARQLGEGIEVSSRYTHKKLDAAIARLRELMLAPDEARHAPRILSEAGVRLVIVEPLAGTKIDGVAIYDVKKPIVALSLRFDRIDYFWFTLMHELAHIRCEHTGHLDQNKDGGGAAIDDGIAPWEREANDFAAAALVPQDKLTSFISRVQPFFSRKKIEGFAVLHDVHPGIVLGQLKNRKAVPWRNLHVLHAKVRDTVTASALCDGWGHFMGTEE